MALEEKKEITIVQKIRNNYQDREPRVREKDK
jgi:hypothetical protein